MLNVKENRLSTYLFIAAMCASVFSVALGLVVMVGWYIQSETLVQVIPAFVPMQYNTALGFILCGTGMSLAIFKKNYSTVIVGSLPIVIGVLTLLEYSMGMNLGIDELFMKHTITVKTSHPGRMAPNTATCFVLIGSVLVFNVFFSKQIYKYQLEAIFASLAFSLGIVALSGYMINLETAYVWGRLTGMAVHTSIGFIVLGVGALALIWRDDFTNEIMLPRWFAVPTAIGTITIAICFWQALQSEYASIARQSDVSVLAGLSRLSYAILVSGVLLAIALALVVYFAQISIRRTREIVKANRILTDEITERKQAEDAINTLVVTAAEYEGQKFFEQTVSRLYDWLSVDYVIIGQLIDEVNIKALAMKKDGEFVNNFTYVLQGSPCADVSKRGYCIYPEGITDLFPNDKVLVQMKAEGYVGVPLKDKRGDFIGVICALSRHKLELPSGAENVFKIISARAAIEFEHIQAEKTVASLAHILEESLNEIYIFDADTLKFVQVNKGGRENLGYSDEELRWFTPLDIKPKFTRESFEKQIEPIRSGENEMIVFETVHQRKDGSIYNVEVHLQLSTFQSRPAFVAIILDITERKKAEQELEKHRKHLYVIVEERTKEIEQKADKLKKSEKALVYLLEDVNEIRDNLEKANIKLKDLDRLKSMFIASMSHELRTPLNSIIGFTGIILQGMVGEISDEQKKQLTMVKNSGSYLLSLINDIIDVSKIEAGKTEVYIQKFDLLPIVKDVINSFSVNAEEKGIKMDLEIPKKIMIESDERRIKQILVNIVGNGVKFTDRGSVSVCMRKLSDSTIEISVADTGIGIKEEDMGKLFKAFSQIPTEGVIQEGTGLGLYLCKRISDLLGGEIKAESEFGKGSTFSLRLPKAIKKD